VASEARPLNVLWLQSAGCGGCTIALLGAESPGLVTALDGAGIRFVWHPALSEESGREALALVAGCRDGTLPLDVLCVEGAMLRGPGGSGRFHLFAGTGEPMIDWVRSLSAVARYTVAVGTCAAFGGIPASGGNETDACGLQYDGDILGGLLGDGYRSGAGLPVINVAGCPTHPGWVLETLLALRREELFAGDLDALGRPRFYTEHLVHHGCPRNEFYEFKASAREPSQLGCLMETLGGTGTQALADCNLRLWHGEGSCLRGGFACVNCTAPGFEEPGHPFATTPKVAGIPTGLPTDMPKAWFVALASLSKSATPNRVRRNAVSDHTVVAPTQHRSKMR
jgi:ferredoxin hydrogenase small subunit